MNTLCKIRVYGNLLSIILLIFIYTFWCTLGNPKKILPSWINSLMIGWFIFHLALCFYCGNGNPFRMPEIKEKEKN
jgi:hypothetical protein